MRNEEDSEIGEGSGEENKVAKIKVYYDGLCVLCSREIDHYRKQKGAANIKFVDICATGFNPAAEGLDPIKVHKEMHVRLTDGSLATRIDAFLVIWETLPKLNWLASLVRQPPIYACLDKGYSIFTKIRPWLPRKRAASDCENSPYCEVKNAKVSN